MTCALILTMLCAAAGGSEVPLIPRQILLEPVIEEAMLSPDGTRLAFVRWHADGPLFVQTVGKEDARAFRPRGGFYGFIRWSGDGQAILFGRLRDGVGHLMALDLASEEVRDYIPFDDVEMLYSRTRASRPDEVLVRVASIEHPRQSLYRIARSSGSTLRDPIDPTNATSMAVGPRLEVSAAVIIAAGKQDLVTFSTSGTPETRIQGGLFDLAIVPPGVTGDGAAVVFADRSGREHYALRRLDLSSHRTDTLLDEPDADTRRVLIGPAGGVAAVEVYSDRPRWVALDHSIEPDLAALRALGDGSIGQTDPSETGSRRLVTLSGPREPLSYWVWDLQAHTTTKVLDAYPELDKNLLAETRPVTFKARDGLSIPGYLTTPIGAKGPTPLVVWAADPLEPDDDQWAFSGEVQLLANRGYSVLRVNHRGTIGFGSKLWKAGAGQLGGKTSDDLVDAAAWAVSQRKADRKKIAVMGSGLAGFSALAAVTRSPVTFACAVDWGGPTNLEGWLGRADPIRAWRKPYKEWFAGDPVWGDVARMKRVSPLHGVRKFTPPILIGHGTSAKTVPISESEALAEAIRGAGGKATFAKFEGASMSPGRYLDDWYSLVEGFLGRCLGGRVEPPDDRDTSSFLTVREIGPSAAKKK
jgi:dipeptidyl aminopeptidase/acylaminoacyl peptidase